MKHRAIVYVERNKMFRCIFAPQFQADAVVMPSIDGLPLDVEVIECFYSPERASFGFILAHDSFDPTPEGGHIPRIDPSWKTIIIEKRKPLTDSQE